MKTCLKTMLLLFIAISLSACSAVVADNSIDYSGQTLTGQISGINGNMITISLGKVKENDNDLKEDFMNKQDQMDGQMMEGTENFEHPQMGEKPELPEGEMPQMPDGEMPELPDGERPQDGMMKPEGDTEGFQGRQGRKEKPEGTENFDPSQLEERPEKMDGQFNHGDMKQFQQTYTFKIKKGEASIAVGDCVITLADGSQGSLSDLKIGDVISITVGQNNEVTNITVYNIVEDEESAE